MPYRFPIDHALKRVAASGRDPVGVADAIELMDRLVAEGVWAYSLLHDPGGSNASEIQRSSLGAKPSSDSKRSLIETVRPGDVT